MKYITLGIIATLLAGCNSAHMQRTLGYGPYQYCRNADVVCTQAGENIGTGYYSFSPEDAQRFMAEGRACIAQSNKANWDSCTARF